MWFNNLPDRRIVEWKHWRDSVANLDQIDIIKDVAKTWATVPTVLHYLVSDNSNDWPSAWELIYENVYCDLAIVVGMFYSIHLIDKNIPIKIQIYLNNNGWVNLLSIDSNKYILNWNTGQVVDTQIEPDPTIDLKLMYTYTINDLKK